MSMNVHYIILYNMSMNMMKVMVIITTTLKEALNVLVSMVMSWIVMELLA